MFASTSTIGSNAKRAREANGFSQANIAEILGVDQSFISKFENGDRSMQSDVLERLANLYGYKASTFQHQDGLPEQRIKTAYRPSGITEDDMKTLHDIKRIAMNLFFMTELAGSIGYRCEQ